MAKRERQPGDPLRKKVIVEVDGVEQRWVVQTSYHDGQFRFSIKLGEVEFPLPPKVFDQLQSQRDKIRGELELERTQPQRDALRREILQSMGWKPQRPA